MSLPLTFDGFIEVPRNKRKHHQSNKNIKKVRKNGPNIPKAHEIQELRDAELLFHSSLFRMEVEELLKEVKPKVSAMKIQEWIDQLKTFLVNMPETPQSSIDDFSITVQVPIMRKKSTDKGVFKFIAPLTITQIGSFTLETVCSSKPVLDLAVEVPKACWQSMDYLNERYPRKRALYLACIAEALQQADFVENLQFSYANDNHLKPYLLIVPQGIQNLRVSVTAYPAEESFKLTRFVPARNNVRSSWLLSKTDEDLEVPTPYYNSAILEDMLLPKLHSFLVENIVSQNVKDGIILIKIWCLQRGLISGCGRLNGFIISMLVAYLLKKQKINTFMNSYQVFRCTLLALQVENFDEGISLCNETKTIPSLEDFQKIFPGVFIDETGFFNLLYSVTKETLNMVKHEAKLGLKILDSEMPNCFTLLFMNKIHALEKFDYLIHLKGPKKFRRYFKKLNDEKDCLNFGENKIAPLAPKICGILRKGLHNKILLLDFIKDSLAPWDILEPPPSPNCGQLTIGLLLNPEVPLHNLEKGPLADDPQAKEFREFWGSQSELRRFQDGSIREAVYWPADTLEDKRRVFSQIVKDILKRHLNAEESDVIVNGAEVDCILHIPKEVLNIDFPPYGTGEEAHTLLMQSFNSLSKQLRNLEGLPLLISSIQGISPVFYFSEVFPPLSGSYCFDESTCFVSGSKLKLKENASRVPPFTPALKVILGFEGSGKWPDDVEAIKRVKAAFLIKIAELVKSKCSLVAVPFLTHTDIIKDGFVFRLMIACHKELFLMKQVKLPNGMTKIRETEEARQVEVTTEILPKLGSLLHGLHQQHNTFGTACRLAKRWVSSQLKYGYIHDTAVELIVAHCYCHPEPHACPSSPQVAFIRFLSLLVNHDWKISPLVVNLNDELQKNELDDIYSSFTSQRSTLPPMVIATPLDRRGSLWTKNRPHILILKRITILAKASLETLQEKFYSMKEFDIKLICRPPLDSYDVIIHLNRIAVPKLQYCIDIQEMDALPQLEPYKEQDNKVYPIVEYDPVQMYLKELRANFDEFAFFFYDVYGGDFIAVVWKKSAFIPKEFKSSHVNHRLLEGDSLIGNMKSILEDFKLLGSGLVKCITKQKGL